MNGHGERLGVGLVLLTLLLAPHTSWGQASVVAGNGTGTAGGAANLPITLDLSPGTQIVSMQFNLTVVPLGGAPALEAPATFSNELADPRPGPNFNFNEGNDMVLVAWLQEIAPPLTGMTQLGRLSVPIPAQAESGQQYRVEVRLPSGASDANTEVPFTGSSGVITVGAACAGDCNGDGAVDVSEVVRGVVIHRGPLSVEECDSFDVDGNLALSTEEIMVGIENVVRPCPQLAPPLIAPSPTPTATPVSNQGLDAQDRGDLEGRGVVFLTPLPRNEVRVRNCLGSPGFGSARCNVELSLAPGVEVATFQFRVIIYQGSAEVPQLTTAMRLRTLMTEDGPTFPLPTFNMNEGNNVVLAGWLMRLAPTVSGVRQIGYLEVVIPPNARRGQTYTLVIGLPSGTSDGMTDVPLVAGPDAVLTVAGRFFGVCDVFPSGPAAGFNDIDGDGQWVSGGEFGNRNQGGAEITNLDVRTQFRESLLPMLPVGSDLFNAMDPLPLDGLPACGGNNQVVNSDVVHCLRLSLLGGLPLVERIRGGSTCAANGLGGSGPPL